MGRGAIGWAAAVALFACARSEPRPATVPGPGRRDPVRAHAPVQPGSPDVVDPRTLPVIPVAAAGEPTVELYAQDVQLDWLVLHLADGPIVSPASHADVSVSGRLVAPSRQAALQAVFDASLAHGLHLRSPDLSGTGRRVDLALARFPAQEMAMLLAELLGDDIIATVDDQPVTVLVRDAPADGVLRALATAAGGTLRREQGVWLLEPVVAASHPFAHRYAPRKPVELWLDAVGANDATELLRAVAPIPRGVCAGGLQAISARLRRAPLALVRDSLFREVGAVASWCGTAEWGGSKPPEGMRVTGIARSGGRAAALVALERRSMLVRSDPLPGARVVIGPTSVGIRTKEWSWEAAVASPELPAEMAGTRDFVGSWRLAATLRDGALWRALLVGDAGAVWVSSAETDRVLSIEPGKVVLPPERPGEPPITLRLRRSATSAAASLRCWRREPGAG